MAKYGGLLPRSLSNQKTNDYLKDLGEMIPCLSKEVVRSFTKEGKRQQTRHEKWELLTTHTARRSFATNEYLAGTPTLTIMAITGHKTEKAFLRYIKLVPSDHARLMKAHWERRKLAAAASMEVKVVESRPIKLLINNWLIKQKGSWQAWFRFRFFRILLGRSFCLICN